MSYPLGRFATTMLLLAALPASSPLKAADWPTWRYDAQRSAVSPQELPEALELEWQLDLPPLAPAWTEDLRLQFDAVYEPIVVGQTLFVSSGRNDSLSAYDTRSGKQKWRIFVDGPVRLAPAYHHGRLYFGADDGRFYCVDAQSGATIWQFDTAAGERLVLGNARLISLWPVRGGAVVSEGKVYFTSGVWPFEGTFLYALDAETGQPAAGDDRAAPVNYRLTTLTDLSPQGYLMASAGRLYFPCGRSKVTCFDLAADQMLNLNYDSKGQTDYHALAVGSWLFHGSRIYNLDHQQMTTERAPRPVCDGRAAMFGDREGVVALDLAAPETVEVKDRRGNISQQLKLKQAWRVPSTELVEVPEADRDVWLREHPPSVDLLAGRHLIGRQASQLFAIDLDAEGGQPRPLWGRALPGTPASVLAADDRLFVVTREGQILCFAAASGKPAADPAVAAAPIVAAASVPAPIDEWAAKAAELLKRSGATAGYAIVAGLGTGRLVEELVRQSELYVVAFDPDRATVDRLRARWDAAGWYGTRIAARVGDLETLALPQYMASLVASEDPAAAGIGRRGSQSVARLFHVLRPYGGSAWLALGPAEAAEFGRQAAAARLVGSELTSEGAFTRLARAGALPGSSEWTHEYGDPANTLTSRDELVKAPLGILWFGGPSADDSLYYDRHDWPPSMVVVEGRIFINGDNKLTAVDVYTGRLLWQVALPEGKGVGRRGNFATSGFHFLGVSDGIYLAYQKECVWFDPATGKRLGTFTLPGPSDRWGEIRVADEMLVAQVFRDNRGIEEVPVALVGMNRHTGQVVWSHEAEHSLPLVAVGAGRVFAFDGLLERLYRDMVRKGLTPKALSDRTLRAFDLRNGNPLWKVDLAFPATWLSFSEGLDVVVASNKDGVAAFRGGDGQPLWQRFEEGKGFGGHPESVWDKVIVSGDRIIDQRGPGLSYYLETGEPVTITHPITGQQVEWEFTKSGHHCNYAIASPHLMTFRAADAGFFDMHSGGTGRLKGFRSGCRNSLLPACGVLNAPNFASGCVCGYSLFTSLSFVHVPENEIWTYSALKVNDGPVRRVGINLGAPGDRQSADGTLWLDYPSVGGSSPDLALEVEGDDLRWFRQHVSRVSGGELSWVAASGGEGIRKLKIPLGATGTVPQGYTVRLIFSEPLGGAPGGRAFDVALQGRRVIERLDVASEAGGSARELVKEFTGIEAAEALVIELTAHHGRSLLCGVEVRAEGN